MKKLLILFFMLVITCFFIWGGMNYSGFCWAKNRWLSDQERIDIAIKKVVGQDKGYIWDGKNGTREYDLIPYISKEDFMDKNPECCKINHYNIESITDFIRRISGKDSGLAVSLSHWIYYKFEEKTYKSLSSIESNAQYQSNCGKSIFYKYEEAN